MLLRLVVGGRRRSGMLKVPDNTRKRALYFLRKRPTNTCGAQREQIAQLAGYSPKHAAYDGAGCRGGGEREK